jgi:hypothetical protein
MEKAEYFIIIPRAEKGDIVVEHYAYDNKMLRTIEGRDARSIYSTIVQNGWVSQLSHAGYLGKELTRGAVLQAGIQVRSRPRVGFRKIVRVGNRDLSVSKPATPLRSREV